MSGALFAPPPIIVLTGAGIARNCGLDEPWFEPVATARAFADDPASVLRRCDDRRRRLLAPSVAPNAAHRALARLDAACPGALMIATWNIDDLHERAGSRAVIHLRGELLKARCTACLDVTEWYDDLAGDESCPRCAIPGQLRPDVVLSGEPLLGVATIYDAVAQCRVLVAIGLSGMAKPMSGFAAAARSAGARTAELAPETSAGAGVFAERIGGPATDVVPPYVERLIAEAAAGR